MSKRYLLGIDIGTSESKGVLCDTDGNIAASDSQAHGVEMPKPGWYEHDAEAVWWGDFVKIAKNLLRKSGISPKMIAGVGVSGLGQDLLPIDEEGNALRKAILYGIDTRAANEIQQMNIDLGRDNILARSANALSTQAVGPKISWLKNNEYDIYKNARYFVTSSSYLIYKLTGNAVLDHHQASFWVPLYDFENREWNKEFCSRYVDVDKLPQLKWTAEVAGTISEYAARETGLPAGTPVTSGASDAFAESISAGVIDPGQIMVMYGSTTCLFMPIVKPTVNEGLWTYRSFQEGLFGVAMCTATSGSVTRWFRDNLARELVLREEQNQANAYDELAIQSQNVPAGANGILLLPYFSGERSPIYDTDACGVFFGLRLEHTRADMYKAVLEGIGMSIRHNIETMNSLGVYPREMIAAGGGIKNPLWLQAVSDICMLEQRIPEVGIGASYGDAFLAGVGAGLFKAVEDIRGWVRYKENIRPDEANRTVYDNCFKKYLKLYENNKELMKSR